MILVNNFVLTDKIRQSFIESEGEEVWKEMLEVLGKHYHFKAEELDEIIKNGNELIV